jgi:hypothetical protein
MSSHNMGTPTLFDAAAPLNEPRYRQGDSIYRLVLDVVEHYVVEGAFSMGPDVFGERTEAGQTLWRYHLLEKDGSCHDVFGEYEMDGRYFDNESAVLATAQHNRDLVEDAGWVVRAGSLALLDARGFIKCAPHTELSMGIGRLGTLGVFEQKAYCYPFLRIFKTERQAKRHYRSVLAELEGQADRAVELVQGDLYRVNETCWSSYEYAKRHGSWDEVLSGSLYTGRAKDAAGELTRQVSRRDKDHER